MGRLFYPLRSIPPFGEEKTFTLYSHHKNRKYGSITLQLHVQAITENIPIEVHIFVKIKGPILELTIRTCMR